MEQNQEIQNAPKEKTAKSSALPWICAIVCFILAIAGLGFGIYGMTRPTEPEKNETTKESDTDTTA